MEVVWRREIIIGPNDRYILRIDQHHLLDLASLENIYFIFSDIYVVMIFYSEPVHASLDQSSYGDQHHRPNTHNDLQCLYLQTYLPHSVPQILDQPSNLLKTTRIRRFVKMILNLNLQLRL